MLPHRGGFACGGFAFLGIEIIIERLTMDGKEQKEHFVHEKDFAIKTTHLGLFDFRSFRRNEKTKYKSVVDKYNS